MGEPDVDQELAAAVITAGAARGLRIAVAESLTGGALASALVGVPGASRVFSGAVVAYDTAVKHSLLRVDAALLAARGPVNAEVARQMARGVRNACAVPGLGADPDVSHAADIGVATTGVAGPDPDPHTGQPAGTVWIGLSVGDRDTAFPLALAGDRPLIRAATVRAALAALLDAATHEPAPRGGKTGDPVHNS
ncbi:C-terminal domain of CinA type S [Leucobacter sp. 7(1)]|uniref:CinA family protein n=1 Tax=Leucobacter sp. 7(1) TaxID=1255613 RepID=UPI00097F208C|nr:nicotinamide-nucleotide amidohydrolase family protein [Leucobacter sp. 7(1)]SJN09571.1 C-terminal domain of CinA type S [Leucobacter sp. 7(1)]